MTKRFAVQTKIKSDADRVWRLLTDGAAYPRWNPAVASVDGSIAPGEKVVVRPAANPKQAFAVRVAEFQASRRMVWRGGMPLGLFVGERVFEITPDGDGVKFSMVETFSGPLSTLIGQSIPDLQPAFDAFAEGLKKAAEA